MEKNWNGMEYKKLMALTWNEKGLQKNINGIDLEWKRFAN